jgi:hypothetical protein
MIKSLAAFFSPATIFEPQNENGSSAVLRNHPHAGNSHHRAGGSSHISNFALNHLT